MLKNLLDRSNVHYGWAVCAACAMVLFCTSGLSVNAFTVYQPFLIDHAGLTNTESSVVITIRSMMSFLSVFFLGWYYRKLSLRVGLSVATMIVAAGFLLFGLGDSFLMYCAAAFFVGVGYGIGTMVPVAMLITRWFQDRRTFAMGICAAATGLSTIGIPNLITVLVQTLGLLPTFAIEAVVILACAAVCLLIVRDEPSKLGIEPYRCQQGECNDGANAAGGADMNGRMWLIAVPALLALGALSTVGFSHLGVLGASQGLDAQRTALMITFAGIALLAGKVLFGEIGDRSSALVATIAFGSAATVGLAMLCLSEGNTVVFFAGTMLYGAGASLSSVGLMTWAADLSSNKNRDESIRRFQLLYGAGGFAMSPVPGMIADACGGSYAPTYAMFAVFAAIVTVSVVWLYGAVRGRAGVGDVRQENEWLVSL